MDNKTDLYRKRHLAIAEFIDAWRLIPRTIVVLYGWGLYEVVKWYMGLRHTLIPGCDLEVLAEKCIIEAPTTQHAVLVTAMVSVAAAVFGFYANSGRKWDQPFKKWNGVAPKPEEKPEEETPKPPTG